VSAIAESGTTATASIAIPMRPVPDRRPRQLIDHTSLLANTANLHATIILKCVVWRDPRLTLSRGLPEDFPNLDTVRIWAFLFFFMLFTPFLFQIFVYGSSGLQAVPRHQHDPYSTAGR